MTVNGITDNKLLKITRKVGTTIETTSYGSKMETTLNDGTIIKKSVTNTDDMAVKSLTSPPAHIPKHHITYEIPNTIIILTKYNNNPYTSFFNK